MKFKFVLYSFVMSFLCLQGASASHSDLRNELELYMATGHHVSFEEYFDKQTEVKILINRLYRRTSSTEVGNRFRNYFTALINQVAPLPHSNATKMQWTLRTFIQEIIKTPEYKNLFNIVEQFDPITWRYMALACAVGE